MLWQLASTYPDHLQPLTWRCPDCGSKCKSIGTPQIQIVSLHVNGGELLMFECERGHQSQPRQEHFNDRTRPEHVR